MQARQVEAMTSERDYLDIRPNDLQPLSDLKDWKLAEGEPDLRGWDVMDQDNNKIGTIDDLLASPSLKKALFAIVSYDKTLGMGGKSTLVPLDLLDLDEKDKQAFFVGDPEIIRNGPEFKDDMKDFGMFYDYWSGMPLAAEEAAVSAERPVMKEGETRVIPETEERLEVGRLQEKVGEVVIREEAEMKPQTVRQKVRKMRVHIFRRDVAPGRELSAEEHALKEGETITIPIIEERLVVEQHPEVTSEIVVQPEVIEEEQEVTRQVHTQHVTVEKHGDVDVKEERAAHG